MPVLAVGMMFVPFWFIRLTANHYKKNIAAELETALSIITTAYLRNEDIQTAVEENIDYLNPPVRSVFVEFLTRIKLVDPDVDAAPPGHGDEDRQRRVSGVGGRSADLPTRPGAQDHPDSHRG